MGRLTKCVVVRGVLARAVLGECGVDVAVGQACCQHHDGECRGGGDAGAETDQYGLSGRAAGVARRKGCSM